MATCFQQGRNRSDVDKDNKYKVRPKEISRSCKDSSSTVKQIRQMCTPQAFLRTIHNVTAAVRSKSSYKKKKISRLFWCKQQVCGVVYIIKTAQTTIKADTVFVSSAFLLFLQCRLRLQRYAHDLRTTKATDVYRKVS